MVIGLHVRVRPEVEAAVRRVSEKHDLTADTVRNLAILLGLSQLAPLLEARPGTGYLERLYDALLEELGGARG